MTDSEKPLRGWKEICAATGVSKNTAKKILDQKGLLQYERKQPVLVFSAYMKTLTDNDRK